jgi:hypothetical protein
MKIPRFTAEASLYTTEERYHMVQIISQSEGAIQPALITQLSPLVIGLY